MDRALLTLVLVVVILVAAYGLLVGWRHRAARQADFPELPQVPEDLANELVEPLSGLYVSTTRAGSWQDRVVARSLGRRAAATVHLYASGILVDRVGESPVFLPAAAVESVGTAPGIAGKVMGMPDGILVLTWALAGGSFDSGVRISDLQAQAQWIAATQRAFPAGRHGNDRGDTAAADGTGYDIRSDIDADIDTDINTDGAKT